MNINLKRKAKTKLTMKIIRNGKEYDLSMGWRIKQFFRESGIQFLNLFRAEKGAADVLTQVGEEQYVSWLDTATQFVAWGTGAGVHSKSSVTLFTEAPEARVTITRTRPLADRLRYEGIMTATAARTITNAGIFTALTGGVLVLASDFTGIALEVGEGVRFQWTVEIV